MFNEARIPFDLSDLPEGESIALSDVGCVQQSGVRVET
ncbi:Uncharacterised protein [Mycobacteroides abscessus subsp. abscessus]|nr:hypothetical protein [Mycobacteroides abscessus]SHW48367.1 Uncharacterised protein [Mycobacteroides abscessus subsp. abscessus]SHX52676.1 Uncharacterised protein [Mycobacteroides abscessus subsp. abscessus]SIE77390.1 Uncharacterised protein [Mycobacteroides abscessus subsp. abscessus]SII18559.1 Uncharacterised protein [Mycobacteroides abscessus subsp. abscessus]